MALGGEAQSSNGGATHRGAATGRVPVLRYGVLAAALAAGLWYLRDPPWLLETTSGIGRWETAADGTRFRWMGAHASLFIPAGAHAAEIPLRTTFDRPGEWPVTVSVSIDDRPADRFVLSDPGWRYVVVRLPPPARRRVRRIDIRVDRTREDNRGAAIGEIRMVNH